MKETRYLWISNLPTRSCENDIKSIFESYGRVLKIKVFEVGHAKGAVVVFLDSKAASQAFSACNALDNVVLDIEYCESNGDPGFRKLKEKVSFKSEINNSNRKLENGSDTALLLTSTDERRTRQNSSNRISRIRSRSSSLSSSLSSHDQSGQGRNIISSKLSSQKSTKTDKSKSHDDSSSHSSTHSEKNRNTGISRGIKVTNLPQRSSDSSIRDGLFHEYKKYGKVMSVVVDGCNENRYAIVSFKCPEHAEKAFEQLKTKVFFGHNVVLERHDGNDVEDTDLNFSDKVMDEYHYRATKTLFVGNLDSEIKTVNQLQDVFKEYGQILDVDIKQSSTSSYAFVQFVDIESVVRALENGDNVRLRGQKLKLGFGKSQANNCIWLSNLTDSVTESFLRRQFSRFGKITQILIDRKKWRALIYFDNIEAAQNSVAEIKNRGLVNKKVQIDYASRECQQHFVNDLYKTDQWHNEMSYNKAAYRTFARYMSSRDMYKYLTTLNMITSKSNTRCDSRERVYHDAYDKISSQYDDQEYSNYRSNTRCEAGVGRSSSSKVDNEKSHFYFDDERKDIRYSSSNLASSTQLGKQKSDSPYSVHSVKTETMSNCKSPPRRLNRNKRCKQVPSSDDDNSTKRSGISEKLLSSSEIVPFVHDGSPGHRRPDRKDLADKRRQQRNLKKTNGRDLSDSSSSLSDSNESDAPQTTIAEVNQLKKLEREKALLLHQLSQLEDGDSDAIRAGSVGGHHVDGSNALANNRLKPDPNEVFDFDYQLDGDKVSGSRLHSEDKSACVNSNSQRHVLNNKESLVNFEDQLQMLRRNSTKEQHGLSNIKTEPFTNDTVTTTSDGTSSILISSCCKSESSLISSSNSNSDLPIFGDKTSGVVPVLHLQQLLSRTLQSQSCSLVCNTPVSRLQKSSSSENISSSISALTKSLSSTPPLQKAPTSLISSNTTSALTVCQQVPRDPRLLLTPISTLKPPISAVTTNFENHSMKSVTCLNESSTTTISKASVSLATNSSSLSVSSLSHKSQKSSLIASTSPKAIPSSVITTSLKCDDKSESSDVSDPENETVMQQHRSLEDRIKALDAKLTKASEPAKPFVDYSKYIIKKKCASSNSLASLTSSNVAQVTNHEPVLNARTGGTYSTTEFVKNMMKTNIFEQDCRRLEQSSFLFESERSVSNVMQPLTVGVGVNNSMSGTSSSLYSPASRGYLSQSSLGSTHSSNEKNLRSSPTLINGLATSWNNNKSTVDIVKTSGHSIDVPSLDTLSIRSILKKEVFSPSTTVLSKSACSSTSNTCTLTSSSSPTSCSRSLKTNCKVNSSTARDTKRIEHFRDASICSKLNWNRTSNKRNPDFSSSTIPQKRKASLIESDDETTSKLSSSTTNYFKDTSLFKPDTLLLSSTNKSKGNNWTAGECHRKSSDQIQCAFSVHQKGKVSDGSYAMTFKSEDLIKKDTTVEKIKNKFETIEQSSIKMRNTDIKEKKYKGNIVEISVAIKKERLKEDIKFDKKVKKLPNKNQEEKREEKRKKKDKVKLDVISHKTSSKLFDDSTYFDKSSKSYNRKLSNDKDAALDKDKTLKQKKSPMLSNSKKSETNEDEWKPSGRSSTSIWGFDMSDHGPYESMYDKIKRRGGRGSQSGKGLDDMEKTSPSISKLHADLQAWLSDVTEDNSSEDSTFKKKKIHLKGSRKRFKHGVSDGLERSPFFMSAKKEKGTFNFNCIKNNNGDYNDDYNDEEDDDEDDDNKYIKFSKRKLMNRKQLHSIVKKAKHDKEEIKHHFVKSIHKNKMTVDSVFGPSSSDESEQNNIDDVNDEDYSSLESSCHYLAKTPSTEPMTDESQTESSNDELKKPLFHHWNGIKPRCESKLQDLFSLASTRMDPRSVTEKKIIDNDEDANNEISICSEDLPCIEKIPYNDDNMEKSPGSIDDEPPSLLDVDMDVQLSAEIFIEEAVRDENVVEPMNSNDLDSAVALIELAKEPRILSTSSSSPSLQLEEFSDSISDSVPVMSEEFRAQLLTNTILNPIVTAKITPQPLIAASTAAISASLPTETNFILSNQDSSISFDSGSIITTSLHNVTCSIMPPATTALVQIDMTALKGSSATPVDQLKKEDMENYVKSVMKKVEEETKQGSTGTLMDKMCKRMKKSSVAISATNTGIQAFDKCCGLDLRPIGAPNVSDIASVFSLTLPHNIPSCKTIKTLLPSTNILPPNSSFPIMKPVSTTVPSLNVQLCKPLLPCATSVGVTCSSATSIVKPAFDTVSNDNGSYSVDERLKRRTILRRKRNSDSSLRSNNDNVQLLTSLEDTINSVLTQTIVQKEKVDSEDMLINTTVAVKQFESNDSEVTIHDLEKSMSQINDSDTELDPYEPNFDETPAFDLKALQHKPSIIRSVDTFALFETNDNSNLDNSNEIVVDRSLPLTISGLICTSSTAPSIVNTFSDTHKFFTVPSLVATPTLETDIGSTTLTSISGNDIIPSSLGTTCLSMAAPANVPTERKSRVVRPMDAETIRHVEEVIELVAHGDVSLEDHIQRILAGEITRQRSNSGDEHTLQRLSVNSSIASVTATPHMTYQNMLLPSRKDNADMPLAQQVLTSGGNMASSSSVTDASTNSFLSNGLFKDDTHMQQHHSVHIGVAGQSYKTTSDTDEHGYVIERLVNPVCQSVSTVVTGTVTSLISSSSISTSVKDTVVSLDTPICGPHSYVQQQQQQQDNPIYLYNALQAYAAMFRAGPQSDPFAAASLYPHMTNSHDPSHLYASYLLNMANRDVATSENIRPPPSSVVVPSLSDGSITTHGQPSTLDISHLLGGNNSCTTVNTIAPSLNENVQRDHMHNLMQKYPIVWQGKMALKNEEAGVQMHFVCGSSHLVKISMDIAAQPIAGESQPLKIVQRMRLEQQQLEGVCRKMQDDNDYCMLLAVACGHDDIDYQRQTISLNNGFIKYLQDKTAAGIVNVNVRDQPAYVVHIFPPSDFSRDKLGLFARDLLQALYIRRDTETSHLLVVITTV